MNWRPFLDKRKTGKAQATANYIPCLLQVVLLFGIPRSMFSVLHVTDEQHVAARLYIYLYEVQLFFFGFLSFYSSLPSTQKFLLADFLTASSGFQTSTSRTNYCETVQGIRNIETLLNFRLYGRRSAKHHGSTKLNKATYLRLAKIIDWVLKTVGNETEGGCSK